MFRLVLLRPLPSKMFPPTLSFQTDYKASGVQLPPNWVGGYRTRSTDMSPYKVRGYDPVH